ncbi:TonB-dependent receptor [Mucilaginibacter sp. PAMB04274]|uniref:TonB-dependent receptor n=1 Tax=Mucilaginibacter sp. PAMB04274 TaxID=3138568 RepID=UPI0031F6156D
MQKLYTLTIAFLLTLICAGSLFAQTRTGKITGKVTTSDGNAATYVSVGLKGISKGAISDENGNYTLNHVKPGTYTLKVTFVGLTTQEKSVTVTAGQTTQANFELSENSSQLTEVVVAGANGQNRAVTVGKSGLRSLDIPQSVQIIDSAIITDQQINRLTDVIRNVNGIALGENRGSTNETFNARGYSLGANNVFKNGARTSLGGSLEASTLESVEVLKGSAALLYGSVTGGAVVNLVTKKPKFNWGGEASMRSGSYGFYKPILDVYGPINKSIAFRFITTKENANSFRDGVSTDRFYINPSLLFNVGKKTELLLQGDYLKSNYTPDFGIGTVAGQIPNIGRSAFINTTWAYNHTKTGTTQANLTHRFNDVWKINVIGAYQSYFRNYFGAERPQAATANGVSPRALTRSQSQEYTYNQQINLTGSAKTGSIKHNLLFGADADQSRTTSYGFKYGDAANSPTAFSYANFNILNPATYQTTLDKPYTRIYQNTVTPVYRMGAFVQDLIGLTDKFKLLAGIRYTWQKQPRANTYNEDTQATTLANNGIGKAKVDKAFSPKVGLIYQPLTTTSVYASYANNFTSNSGVDVSGAPLGPSILDQYEVGVKNDLLNGRLSVNVTAYRIINNRFAQTAQFQADGITPNSDTNVKEFSGKTSSDGVELDITGKLSSNVYFLAGYAYNFIRYTSTLPNGITEGERIVGSVPHTANGTVFYTFKNGNIKGLKLGLSGYYTGARNSGFNTLKTGASRGVPVHLNGYTTFDVSAGYTIKKVSLLAKVSNLTNELNYLVHENYSVNPIPPRMLSATASYRF